MLGPETTGVGAAFAGAFDAEAVAGSLAAARPLFAPAAIGSAAAVSGGVAGGTDAGAAIGVDEAAGGLATSAGGTSFDATAVLGALGAAVGGGALLENIAYPPIAATMTTAAIPAGMAQPRDDAPSPECVPGTARVAPAFASPAVLPPLRLFSKSS